MNAVGAVLLALLAGSSPLLAAQTAAIPGRDPFQKPELELVLAPEPEAELSAEVAPSEPTELPELRAILHSPRTTLVNLDGKLVAIGGKYQDYRVAAAGERDVVLLLGDDTYVVSIDTRKKDKEHVRQLY